MYGYKKGEVPVIDGHVSELLEKKADRFPKLCKIEGVDEFLPGVPGTYHPDNWSLRYVDPERRTRLGTI